MTPAEKNLRECQRQLDMDGAEVGVSRQALDEVLAELERLRHMVGAYKIAQTGEWLGKRRRLRVRVL